MAFDLDKLKKMGQEMGSKLKSSVESVDIDGVMKKAKTVADKSLTSVGIKQDHSLASLKSQLADLQAKQASLKEAIQKAEAEQASAGGSEMPKSPNEVQQTPNEVEQPPTEQPNDSPVDVPHGSDEDKSH